MVEALATGSVTVPDGWLQGRTVYGGLSTALALAETLRLFPDLPPLRSAQIAFVGPLAGEMLITPTLLRRGRTAAFVQADVCASGNLGLRAMFVFMHAQDSHVAMAAPDLADLPTKGRSLLPPPEVRFAQNFELLDGRMDVDEHPARITRWARLRLRDGLAPAVELMAIGDALPPAAMTLFGKPGPISSMTWQINPIGEPSTPDGWWLLQSSAHQAEQGSSSQSMAVWTADGALAATGMQSVALFV